MFRRLLIAVFLFIPFLSFAQPGGADSSHLRISLLTVGTGDEIYAAFGHTGIRITDSVSGKDEVYNYGTFDGFDKDFEMKFARGKLLYYISSESFANFMNTYVHEERSVQEQQLFLNGRQKEELRAFLINNERPENRYYKYDFLYDNCATRIRDVFPKTFGAGFQFGRTMPAGSKLTFRHIINHYLAAQHWERLGINLCLGSRIDKVMGNEDVMFLPDYLRDGIGNGTVNGQKIATAPVTILRMPPMPPAGPDIPMWVMIGVGALTILGLSVPQLRPLGKFLSNLLLIFTGLLGCFLLFMWLGTDHQGCRNNLNLLWALPTNLMLPFLGRRGKDKYAVLAILLLLLSLLLHVLGIQELALTELWPLLLALLYIYGMIYRRDKLIKAAYVH